MRVALVVVIALFSCAQAEIFDILDAKSSLFAESNSIAKSEIPASIYPPWAHSHWVWLSNDQENQINETNLVDGYLSRDIPVGAIDIDSEWSTGINDFIFDTTKFPNATAMVEYFHSLNIKVICWVTSMVDTDSPNYEYGKQNNYYLNDGKTIHWWHGEGSFIDYTCPAAVDWWHSQMDYVLDIGIDGWKCDGTDPYVFELIYPRSTCSNTHVHERQYANDYYGDFFNYTRTKNDESLIMSRPVDSFCDKTQSDCLLYWSFSPHYVMFSGWVGDQDPTFDGMQSALRNMFHSAWRNYTNFGSDIGGYRTNSSFGPYGRSKQLFTRWAQMGAFTSLMENGGGGEHRPWMFSNETTEIYRKFVLAHYEIGPYLLNAGNIAYKTGVSVMDPISAEDYSLENPKSYDYFLWEDLFISPIVENTTAKTVEFPAGDDWVDFFNHTKVFTGGKSYNMTFSLAEFPAYIRKGSLMPLDVKSECCGHGGTDQQKFLTIYIPHPYLDKDYTESSSYINWKDTTQEFFYANKRESRSLAFTATPHKRELLLLIDWPNSVASHSIKVVDHLNKQVVRLSDTLEEVSDSTATMSLFYIDYSSNRIWIKLSSCATYGCKFEIFY